MPGVCDEIIDDIEDLISSQDITPKERYASRKSVNVRSRKRDNKNDSEPAEKVILESVVPGTQTIYVKTWGCAHNNSDSEYMAGLLAANGYKLTEDKFAAQLWLLNSCTVKSPSEDHFKNEIELGQSKGIHVVVAGCVPQGAPRANYLTGLSVVGVQQIDRIVEIVEETLKGCLNQCTYCKTKHARGELGSYPPEEIVERARQSFTEGVCEIWLTSEDTGTYGRDIGTSLPELLWKLVEVIPEGCRLRLGMTNPPYILEHLAEVAKIMHHPRVYKFLHVPVQSGSDQVLSDMKREYTRADFEKVPTQEVKKRTKKLSELFRSYEPYGHKVGEIQEVLVTDISHDKNYFVAHNEYYEQVLVPKEEKYMGKMLTVKITSATKFSMMGEPIDKPKMAGLTAPLKKGVVSGVTEVQTVKNGGKVPLPLPIIMLIVAVVFKLIWIFL
ncbi:hypothetical protein HF086_013479 [Spodoptera exigua]|uniref:Threonylcarbamoyladenosine tRNA methylthiotransferase n=1 Tax=Spodoptera exigua TaxID=7107 RepID=A0A922SG37_SPOEX|nr:hypothetical protein HF086_013479 [Spodoptera exigua]